MTGFEIDGRPIGPGHHTYIVAELSANHLGNYDRAKALVEAAAEAGADAVKLQTYTPDTMTLDSDLAAFRISEGSIWSGRKLYDLYAEAQTPWEWHAGLKSLAEGRGLQWFSTPFDAQSANFLMELRAPAFKIASFELVDLPLLRHVAGLGKPVIMSTGMASQIEIDEAVATMIDAGCVGMALLKCTSAYPAAPNEMNLRAIQSLEDRYRVVAGLSDHSRGTIAAVAAVALGASIVEKHITLSRADGGPDAEFSLEPAEFAELCQAIRDTEQALGDGELAPVSGEEAHSGLRRSLYVAEDVAAGEILTPRNVRTIRPGGGLHPRFFDRVLGRTAAIALSKGTPLSWNAIVGGESGSDA